MIGWIIMLTAIETLRYPEEHGRTSKLCSVFYFAGIPVVVWDYFINSNRQGINWIMTKNILNMAFRYSFIVCGVYLLVTGIELIYLRFKPSEDERMKNNWMCWRDGIHKTGNKTEES